MTDLPAMALSVRQPWAWAIIHAGKDVENRTVTAIAKGGMKPGRVCIHAAKGMTRHEYEIANRFIASLGCHCPRPDALIRGGIIGAATVVDIVKDHLSPWFFGPRGLVLQSPVPLDPIAGAGALGFFEWRRGIGGSVCAPQRWMVNWTAP